MKLGQYSTRGRFICTFSITKLRGIIPAGETGILSVKSGIETIAANYASEDIVILQEATRPLITEEMI